jgi:Flp pilus assembly CpaF family ATPase
MSLKDLVDDRTIENIMITGYDRVFVERTDGTIERMPAVAASDEDLPPVLRGMA